MKKYCTATEKQAYLDQFHLSGLSQSEFCRRHQLKLPTFNKWLMDATNNDQAHDRCDLSLSAFSLLQVVDEDHDITPVNITKSANIPPSKAAASPDIEDAPNAPLCLKINGFCLDIPVCQTSPHLKETLMCITQILHTLGTRSVDA